MEGSKASLLPHRDLLITQGTVIPCVLETAMDSTLPGLVTCMLPRTILSDTGTVELLEKGTKIVGEYQGGMQQGQERIFVLWTRAETPRGVIINLGSPASDPLGRSGFDGEVDNHFWERFGGALLLSIADDAALVAQTGFQGNGSNNSNYYAATGTAGQEATAIALENTINIQPTLRKNQGEMVSIFVARDLDFSGVYTLRPMPGATQPVAARGHR
jgi:type IV secretion system protein VirB10